MIGGQKEVSVTPKCHNLFEDFSTVMSLHTTLMFVTFYTRVMYGSLSGCIFALWTGQKFHTVLHVSTQFLYSIKRTLLSGIFQLEIVGVRKYTYGVTNSSMFAPFCIIISKENIWNFSKHNGCSSTWIELLLGNVYTYFNWLSTLLISIELHLFIHVYKIGDHSGYFPLRLTKGVC